MQDFFGTSHPLEMTHYEKNNENEKKMFFFASILVLFSFHVLHKLLMNLLPFANSKIVG